MTDSPFRWIPCQGPDATAPDRMMRAFPKPRQPMGKAWFMGEVREMYPQLLGELDALPDDEIVTALVEIASGSSSFGRLPEWVEWFHYLLPRLVGRRWMPSVLPRPELLVTAFIAQHPATDAEEPYRHFTADALNTLGRVMMSPRYWRDGAIDVRDGLGKWIGPTGIAGWYDVGGLLSASLFFCLKYLPAAQVEEWFRSVLAIADLHWRIQVLTWLVGAHPLLSGEIDQPSQFPESGPFGVRWDWSHALDGHYSGDYNEPVELIRFLPDDRGATVLRLGREYDATATFDLLASDPAFENIAIETAGLRERFAALYSRPSR